MASRLQDGVTPAYIAAQNGHAAVLALLRDAGADLNKAKNVSWPIHSEHPPPPVAPVD